MAIALAAVWTPVSVGLFPAVRQARRPPVTSLVIPPSLSFGIWIVVRVGSVVLVVIPTIIAPRRRAAATGLVVIAPRVVMRLSTRRIALGRLLVVIVKTVTIVTPRRAAVALVSWIEAISPP
jgi:hypothetical protein